MFSRHKYSCFVLLLIFCLYLFFPSGLSTSDGWYYAATIKHLGEIFHPHHLLYNALGLGFCWLPSKAGFEIISCLKVMNGVFAILTLLVIQQILFYIKVSERNTIIIICLAGFSFSILRYATENETYIVPLFFALLASFKYLKFLTTGKNREALIAGFLATISVLFHQSYIFWWFGLLIGFCIEKSKRPALLYLIISLTAPVIYMIVIMVSQGGYGWKTISNFILGDLRGNVSFEITGKGVLLSVINLIRSFVQIHGYIFKMIRENLILLVPGIISLIFVLSAFRKVPVKLETNISNKFSAIHIIILMFQFIFAVFSSGNAEFMVMIPVLIFLLVPFFTLSYEKFLFRIMIAMAVWNISYGLIPLHYKTQEPEQFLCNVALTEKDAIIVASDDKLLINMLYYEVGDNIPENIIKSPAAYEMKGKNAGILEGIIDSALNTGTSIYTNCLDEAIISRSSILEGNKNKDFFRSYQTIKIQEWKFNTGIRSIYIVKRKE